MLDFEARRLASHQGSLILDLTGSLVLALMFPEVLVATLFLKFNPFPPTHTLQGASCIGLFLSHRTNLSHQLLSSLPAQICTQGSQGKLQFPWFS